MLRERSENGAKHEVPPQSGEARREYEDAVACGGVCHHHMGNGADASAVLQDGAAAQECGQVGTTRFYK